MKEILHRLDNQDKSLEQIKWLLKGSEALEIPGVIPSLKRLEADVHDIKQWRSEQTMLKGKIDVKTFFQNLGFAAKPLGVIATIGGGSFGIFQLIRMLFE